MKMYKKKSYKLLRLLSIFLFILNSINLVFGQGPNNSSINDSIKVDSIYSSIELPLLQTFIESGLQNSPILKINDNEIEQVIQRIKIEKSAWLDNIFIEGITKYGLFNQLIISGEAGSNTNEVGVQSANQQFNYFGGLSMKIPISDFLNSKKSIKILNKGLRKFKIKEATIN